MDQSGLGMRDLDRLLEETRQVLGDMSTNPSPPAGLTEPSELRGEGTASEGRIQATVVTGGRLEEVRLDPRALRMGSEVLGEQIVVAVNAALEDLRAKALEAAPPVPDPGVLSQRLGQLQVESIQRMEKFTQGVADAVQQITQAAEGRHGG